MSLIGACCYRWGPDVEAKLRLLQPHHVVVTDSIWNDLPVIIAACPPDVTIILRNMADNLFTWAIPDVVSPMLAVAHKYPNTRFVAHALNESHSPFTARAAQWEWDFIQWCHDYDLKTICLNGAYGNDPDNRFEAVASASTYVGWHLYDGYDETREAFVDRVHTSRRYERDSWPKWWPKHKHIATEVGIEAFPATGQRRGWHDMGIPEETVRLRMLANALHWKADGLLGVCWFTAGHTEQSWNEGYGMTEGMARLWGEKGPQPNQDGAQPPIDNGGKHMATLKQMLDELEAKGLAGQITLNAGKKAASYTEMGSQVDLTHNLFGDVVNLAREAKKALETPIPV